MRTTWEKIYHHVGTIYGHDTRKELQNKTNVSIPKPEYTEDVQLKHKQIVELLNLQSARLGELSESKIFMLTQAVEDGNDPEAPAQLAMLENEIDEANCKASIDPENHPMDAEKTEHDNV